MAMVVKNNMSAVNTLNTLNKNQSSLATSLAKVSSGQKINSAQDDASGYAISERMRVRLRALDQANENTQNGSSLMKTAEGAVASTVEILNTLKKKAINAATATITDEDRRTIQKEIDQFVDQIDDNALISYNGKYLLDGSKTGSGKAVYGSLTNQALSTDTTALSKLTELTARNGESLIIESTDRVTVSYVHAGRTYTTTYSVGDTTLGDIFRAAEEVNADDTIFATAGNDDVGKAGGLVTGKTTKDMVNEAVEYLQDALSFNSSTYNGMLSITGGTSLLTTTTDDNSNTNPHGLDIVTLSIWNNADIGSEDENAVVDEYFKMNPQSATGMSTSYNGEIFQKVKDALNEYNSIVKSMGNSSTGMAQSLRTALADYLNATWDGEEGDVYGFKDQIYNDTGTGRAQLIQYYEAYTNAAASKQDAKNALNAAVTEYNEGLVQLDALVKLKAVESAKLKYTNAVENFANSLRTAMRGATEGTFTLPAGVADNPKVLSYTAGSSTLSEAEQTKAIEAIVDAVSDKLYDILAKDYLDLSKITGSSYVPGEEVGSFESEDDSSTTNIILRDIAAIFGYNTSAISDNADGNTEEDGYSSLSNYFTYTDKNQQMYRLPSDLPDTSGSAGGILTDTIGTAVTTLAEAVNYLLGNVDNENENSDTMIATWRKYLDLAQNDTLADFTGPALLTGANVGVNASNKVVTTPDGTAGLTITAAQAGLGGQIAGFSISISDAEGNVRKSVDTVLNSWTVLNFAQNESVTDNALKLHVGAQANQTISVGLSDMRAEALGLKGSDGKVVDVSTVANANAAISVFDNALQKALDMQTTIGAVEARLEYTSSNLTTSSSNVQSSESVIRDADMAKEMTEYTKNNVLLQAAQSMLAQANQNSSAVLSLLQ